MRSFIYISTMVLLITTTQVIANDSTVDISSEAQQFKNELNALSDEANQKVMSDANYSDKVKTKASEKINQIKLNDETIQKFLNDTNVSEKKKHEALKELNKFKVTIEKKLHKEKAQVHSEDSEE